jgi:5'-nucleotidase
MNNNRRQFLQNSSLLAAGYLLAKPFKTVAGSSKNSFVTCKPQPNSVNIIHTTDLHGRLHPFAFGELQSIGGLHNIHSVVKDRTSASILVDAGGFLNDGGSFSDHAHMITMMSKTNYAAVTIGGNELLQGEKYLASLVPYMNFALINCNYDFSEPMLKAKVVPYYIVRYGEYKVGITGVGPVIGRRTNTENIAFGNPYERASEVAAYLKSQKDCDLVVCLSNLGFEQKNRVPDNKGFAAASEGIDIIIGGNDKAITHPQMVFRNSQNKQVVLSTGGYGGSILGSVTFGFNETRQLQSFNSKNYVPGSDAGSSFFNNLQKLTA